VATVTECELIHKNMHLDKLYASTILITLGVVEGGPGDGRGCINLSSSCPLRGLGPKYI